MVASLIVTGFGKFRGVESNPSEWLVKQLAAQDGVGDDGSSDAGRRMFEVLEVSAEYVQHALSGLAKRTNPAASTIWVHFGVDGTASSFKLERQAFNEAHFRVPDEAGWQPHHEAIDSAHSVHHTLRSTLPLDELAGALEKHDVHLSYDAGRFVCNYTLYESLRQCQHQQQEQLRRRPSERGRWQAVFVHVPSFSVVPAERQLAFATDLLQLLALQPATEPQQDEAGAGSHGSLQQLLCWVQQQKVPAMFACLTTWFTLKTK